MTIDDQEIAKFDSIAPIWWDPSGEMRNLLKINPLRLKFITRDLDLASCRVLDVGCGGGVFSEALASEGARVTGIDLSFPSLEVARKHAEIQGLQIDYRYESLEDLSTKIEDPYDVVVCMEMLEHTPDPEKIIELCAGTLRPGGHLYCSTINRKLKAFIFAIIGGEYVLRLLPRGSHTYNKFIRPSELNHWAHKNGLRFVQHSSLIYNPFTGRFKVVEDKADVFYMTHFIKD